MKKTKKIMPILLLMIMTITFIEVARADDSGSMALTSEKDAAWSGYTYFGKNTPTIQYTRKSGTGSFFTKLQTKKLFGYKDVGQSGTTTWNSESYQSSVMFPNAGAGNYRFQAQWKSGALQMSYSTFSVNS